MFILFYFAASPFSVTMSKYFFFNIFKMYEYICFQVSLHVSFVHSFVNPLLFLVLHKSARDITNNIFVAFEKLEGIINLAFKYFRIMEKGLQSQLCILQLNWKKINEIDDKFLAFFLLLLFSCLFFLLLAIMNVKLKYILCTYTTFEC